MIKPATNDCKSNCPQTEDKNQPYKPPLDKLNYTKAEIDKLSPAERDKMAFAKTADGKYIRTHWDACEIENMTGKQLNQLGILTNPDGGGDRPLGDDEMPVDPWWDDPSNDEEPPHEYKYENPVDDPDYDYPEEPENYPEGGTNDKNDPGIPGPGPNGEGGTPPTGKVPSYTPGEPGTYYQPSPDKKYFTREEMAAMTEEDKRRLGIYTMPNGTGMRAYWTAEEIEALGPAKVKAMGIEVDPGTGVGTVPRPAQSTPPKKAPEKGDTGTTDSDVNTTDTPADKDYPPADETSRGDAPNPNITGFKPEPAQKYFTQDEVNKMDDNERRRIGVVKLADGRYMRTSWSKEEMDKVDNVQKTTYGIEEQADGSGNVKPDQDFQYWYSHKDQPEDPNAKESNTTVDPQPNKNYPPANETARGDVPNPNIPGDKHAPDQKYFTKAEVDRMDDAERRRIGLVKLESGQYQRTTWSKEEMEKLDNTQLTTYGIEKQADGSGRAEPRMNFQYWYSHKDQPEDPNNPAKSKEPPPDPAEPQNAKPADETSRGDPPNPNITGYKPEPNQMVFTQADVDKMEDNERRRVGLVKTEDGKYIRTTWSAEEMAKLSSQQKTEMGIQEGENGEGHYEPTQKYQYWYSHSEQPIDPATPTTTTTPQTQNVVAPSQETPTSEVPDPVLPQQEGGEDMKKILANMSDDWLKNKLKDTKLTFGQRNAILDELIGRHLQLHPGDREDLEEAMSDYRYSDDPEQGKKIAGILDISEEDLTAHIWASPSESGPKASAPPDPVLPKEGGQLMDDILNNMSDNWLKNKLKDENLTWDQRNGIMHELVRRHNERFPEYAYYANNCLGQFQEGELSSASAAWLVEHLGLESRDIIYKRPPGFVHPKGTEFV